MPRVEETLAGYIFPGVASSLKPSTLPTKPLRTTSALVGNVNVSAGQATGCLHTMSVLQAYQADLLQEPDVKNIMGGQILELPSRLQKLKPALLHDLSWSCHINTLVKKVRQRLYHLRHLKDFKLPSQVLKTFYTCTYESVLSGSMTFCFWNSSLQDRQALQWVVRSAEHTKLPDLQDIYSKRCRTRARKIVKDRSHK